MGDGGRWLGVGNRSSLLQSRKESGLQSPPTRGFPPTKESGIGVPSYKEQIVLESGLQSPPTREFRRTEEGNLKLYLTFVRKYWIIRVASWSEVKPTPS